MTSVGSAIVYTSFYGENGPDLRAIHIEQHAQEGARLDSLISVLEETNSNPSNPSNSSNPKSND